MICRTERGSSSLWRMGASSGVSLSKWVSTTVQYRPDRSMPYCSACSPARRSVIPSLLVLATLDIGHMMLHVAGMSFLGLGVTAPTAEWGVMINDARQYIWTQPLQMFWPGLALFISVMAFNLVGDALRDHLDPHLVTEHAH